MSVWENVVVPRLVDFAMGMKAFDGERKKTLEEVRGNVLEIGFGTGRNLPHYPQTVEKLTAIDPSGPSAKLAIKRIENAIFPIEYIELSSESLPSSDATFDAVVSTFTLCTIPDVERALLEVRRVLKPGGKLYFLEHGLADDPKTQKWQHRLEPLQKAIFGGCHLTRAYDRLVTDAGLKISSLERFEIKAPKPHRYIYRGSATRTL